MKVNVRQCCHSSNVKPQHMAGVGDVVLLAAEGGGYFDATIREVKSPLTVVVAFMVGAKESLKEIQAEEVEGLMLGD